LFQGRIQDNMHISAKASTGISTAFLCVSYRGDM